MTRKTQGLKQNPRTSADFVALYNAIRERYRYAKRQHPFWIERAAEWRARLEAEGKSPEEDKYYQHALRVIALYTEDVVHLRHSAQILARRAVTAHQREFSRRYQCVDVENFPPLGLKPLDK